MNCDRLFQIWMGGGSGGGGRGGGGEGAVVVVVVMVVVVVVVVVVANLINWRVKSTPENSYTKLNPMWLHF